MDAEFYALFRFRTSGVDLCNLCEYDRVVIEKTGFEVLALTPTRGYASFKELVQPSFSSKMLVTFCFGVSYVGRRLTRL